MTPLRRFSTSNGCQDHTTSPSAKASFVCVPFVSSRAFDPPCHPLTSPDAIASTASRPAFVTIASRPSVGRDAGDLLLIWVRRERKYFCNQDWTGQITLIRFNKSPATRSERQAVRAKRCSHAKAILRRLSEAMRRCPTQSCDSAFALTRGPIRIADRQKRRDGIAPVASQLL